MDEHHILRRKGLPKQQPPLHDMRGMTCCVYLCSTSGIHSRPTYVDRTNYILYPRERSMPQVQSHHRHTVCGCVWLCVTRLQQSWTFPACGWFSPLSQHHGYAAGQTRAPEMACPGTDENRGLRHSKEWQKGRKTERQPQPQGATCGANCPLLATAISSPHMLTRNSVSVSSFWVRCALDCVDFGIASKTISYLVARGV